MSVQPDLDLGEIDATARLTPLTAFFALDARAQKMLLAAVVDRRDRLLNMIDGAYKDTGNADLADASFTDSEPADVYHELSQLNQWVDELREAAR